MLENYNNLEKECEGAKQPVSIELQVLYPNPTPTREIRSLRSIWYFGPV